jgi:hypothetical protein
MSSQTTGQNRYIKAVKTCLKKRDVQTVAKDGNKSHFATALKEE